MNNIGHEVGVLASTHLPEVSLLRGGVLHGLVVRMEVRVIVNLQH